MKEKEIREMIERREAGESVAELAKLFSITKTHAYYVLKGKTRVAKKVLTISKRT